MSASICFLCAQYFGDLPSHSFCGPWAVLRDHSLPCATPNCSSIRFNHNTIPVDSSKSCNQLAVSWVRQTSAFYLWHRSLHCHTPPSRRFYFFNSLHVAVPSWNRKRPLSRLTRQVVFSAENCPFRLGISRPFSQQCSPSHFAFQHECERHSPHRKSLVDFKWSSIVGSLEFCRTGFSTSIIANCLPSLSPFKLATIGESTCLESFILVSCNNLAMNLFWSRYASFSVYSKLLRR